MGNEQLMPHLLQKGRLRKQSLRLRIECRHHTGNELTKDVNLQHTICILQKLEYRRESPKGERLRLYLAPNTSLELGGVIQG